ncbi:MAG: hypothetical protein IKQ55_06360 [Kiritimatiellae bacterium]|nr:hypothetical protein [Kiritimatiellia bacterium]
MKKRLAFMAFLAAVGICALWAYTKVHTYATGQDPKTYLLLAKQILHGDFGAGGAWLVVPGWPLVLAGVMKVFGVHAAFWTNVPLFTLLVGVLAALAGNLSGSWRRGALVAAGAALLMLGGSPYNPHFLLWAFRQTPVYLTSALSLLFLERAVARRAAGKPAAAVAWLGGSLAWVAAGVLVRETGVLLLPAMGLYLLADALGWIGPAGNAGAGRGRWLLAGVFAGAGAAGALALAAALALGLVSASAQTSYMMGFLPNLFNRSSPLLEMAGWIPEELGRAGFAALLLGIVLSFRRRNRGYLLLFLVPAATYLLFDGMLKAHRRFFLSTLFFLSPVAMMGATAALAAAWRALRWALARAGLPERWLGAARLAGWLAAWLAVAFWCRQTVRPIGPWGVQARRGNVTRALEAMAPLAGPDRPLLLDNRARFLKDIVEVFTDWPEVVVDRDNAAACVQDPPLAFVQPLNPEALHWAESGAPAHRLLERWGRLEEVPDSLFRLGPGLYKILRVAKWDKRSVEYRLPPPPKSALVPPPGHTMLRLQAPECAADRPIRVSLGGRRLADRLSPGYQFLGVPREWLETPEGDGAFGLVIEADEPIPDEFQPTWLHPDSPLEMEFGAVCEPSAVSYLSPEFRQHDGLSGLDPDFPYWPAPSIAREFAGDGDLRIPEGFGDPGAAYLVKMTFQTLHHDPSGRLAVTVSAPEFPDAASATDTRPFLAKPQTFTFDLGTLPAPPRTLHIHADCEVEFPAAILGNPRHADIQLASAMVEARRDVDELLLGVGNSGDGVMIGEGFFGRERADSPDHGRWTKDRSELRLPLKGGRDYRLELAFSQYRPEAAPPAELRLTLNGHPLELEPTETGVAGRIEDAWLGGSNTLAIECATWCPADYGAPDRRRLGIFLRTVRARPAGDPAGPEE